MRPPISSRPGTRCFGASSNYAGSLLPVRSQSMRPAALAETRSGGGPSTLFAGPSSTGLDGGKMQGVKIGVIGAGLMGHGIAYLLAAAGHTVAIYDPSAAWRASLTERLKSANDL